MYFILALAMLMIWAATSLGPPMMVDPARLAASEAVAFAQIHTIATASIVATASPPTGIFSVALPAYVAINRYKTCRTNDNILVTWPNNQQLIAQGAFLISAVSKLQGGSASVGMTNGNQVILPSIPRMSGITDRAIYNISGCEVPDNVPAMVTKITRVTTP